MSTLEPLASPVNLAAAEAAYKRATAAVDARLAETSDPHDARLLALIADEEAAYEAMFHHAAERERRGPSDEPTLVLSGGRKAVRR